ALALLISPILGFCCAAGLLLLMKRIFKSPELYEPPVEGATPPRWIRWTLLGTCGGVSLAHGSNDGQKGMGLILLVLIGFLPTHYALNVHEKDLPREITAAATSVADIVQKESPQAAAAIRPDMETINAALEGKASLAEVAPSQRWAIRQAIFRFRRTLQESKLSSETRRALAHDDAQFAKAVEFVPYWVVIGVATTLGVGTAIGYKRIVVTVAEKIGKTHLTYAQGAAAEIVAAATIGLADFAHMPVSTTHVLSSGVAGTMAANHSGLRGDTIRKIGLAWVLTLPAAILLAASFFWMGCLFVPAARPDAPATAGAPVVPGAPNKGTN
ncbi:MAG TPA: inorganic phosphate transporter, partial [Planctomycetaceae bacterium]|nr:inorganic phosphate transporter [Planctomycetaceae bacterium]